MKKVNRFASIRMNMLFYGLSVIILMTILSVYSISIMERYKGQIEGMFEKHLYLSQIESTLGRLDENLLGFLTTKSSTKLNNYLIDMNDIQQMMDPSYREIYNMEDVFMKNIVHLTQAYKDVSDQAITYKRQRNVTKYYEYYEESKVIKSYIQDYIQDLNARQLARNSRSYSQLLDQIRFLQQLTSAIVIMLIVLSLLIVFLITSKMVKPINSLVHASEEIAKGNLNTEDVVVDTENEWLVLSTAFNNMKNSISSYIDDLHTQAEIENRLKDEQLKNIRMAHLLDSAKLYALQSQINPHFLFNTINAGVQLSVLERAPKTGRFLDTMSSLFRYNIQKMDSVVTLEDEINNIKDYYELLSVRFGQRIRFEFHIDQEVLDTQVPPLILQPLVENAYIHGLSTLEEGGTITINSYKKDGITYLIVKDTGLGMSAETISALMARDEGSGQTGIGVRNVRDRLELFFHATHIFRIESKEGMGTKIIMTLPVME